MKTNRPFNPFKDNDEDSKSEKLDLASGEMLIAQVIVETHPITPGRVLVTGNTSNQSSFECWLAAVQSLEIRAGDRVCIQQPSNFPEPIVTGVLDSVHRKPVMAHRTGAELSLRADETLRVKDQDGNPLLDIKHEHDGSVVQLHTTMSALDMPGAFRLIADTVEIDARQGEMKLAASGDIHMDGEVINLN